MIKTGGGAIVNTASGAGIEGSPNMAPYTASKFGIVGLTKSVALEYGQQGIRVNAIAPGATITPAIKVGLNHHLINIMLYYKAYLQVLCLPLKIKVMQLCSYVQIYLLKSVELQYQWMEDSQLVKCNKYQLIL